MSTATTAIDNVENVTPIPRPARAPALRDGFIVCAASGEGEVIVGGVVEKLFTEEIGIGIREEDVVTVLLFSKAWGWP